MRFRKKPVEVEAIRFKGDANIAETLEFVGDNGFYSQIDYNGYPCQGYIKIITLHGIAEALRGDWIIKGPNGGFWPCQDLIFEESYEVVE